MTMTLAYKDSSLDSTYFGIENAFTVPLKHADYVKLIVNADLDEEESNNYRYALSYSKMFSNMLTLNVTGASTEMNDEKVTLINASLNISF